MQLKPHHIIYPYKEETERFIVNIAVWVLHCLLSYQKKLLEDAFLTYRAFGCHFYAHKKHSSNGEQYFAPTCLSPVNNNFIYLKEQNTQIQPNTS